MSLSLVAARAAAIDTHLFLLCPNNSGSTYLGAAIAQSRHVCSLPAEGQHVVGYGGPNTRNSPWPLIWAGSPESTRHFAEAQYDWQRTRKAWHFHATGDAGASVFFTKSPPFLLIADQLAQHFDPASFILMVRDPYAALEGIVRRHRRSGNARSDLAEIAARHLVACFQKQRQNREALAGRMVFFTYEDLCLDPARAAQAIQSMVPVLDDLDLAQRLPVKGLYDEPLRNMNAEQIARLSDHDIAAANRIFVPHLDALEYFGYSIRQ